MFNRKQLSVAVTAAIGAIGAFSSSVQADSALWPHIVVSPSVTTIVSVINTSGDLNGDELHYRLFYKEADKQMDACQEGNAYLPSSKNDIQTIDLGARFSDNLGVMFEPNGGVKNPWKDALNGSAWGYAMGAQVRGAAAGVQSASYNAMRGILVVDNDDDRNRRAGPSVFGEAIVVEFENGGSWGYTAFGADDDSDSDEFDYSDVGSLSGYPVAFMPPAEVSTSFLVTPILTLDQFGEIESSMLNPSDYTATIFFGNTTAWDKDEKKQETYVAYDRDENPISGTVPATVKCVGRVELESLLSTFAQTSLRNGGWGSLNNSTSRTITMFGGLFAGFTLDQEGDLVAPAGDPRTIDFVGGVIGQTYTVKVTAEEAAIIYKLEYGQGTINGYGVNGVWNNLLHIPPVNFYDASGYFHSRER